MTIRDSQTYDNLLLLKDAGAITVTGAATVAAAPRVIDMGLARFRAKAIVDTSALDLTDTNETYRVAIQGCTSAAFGTGVVELGSVAVTQTGRSEVDVVNQVGSQLYQFIRAFITLGGTTPSVSCTVFLAKH